MRKRCIIIGCGSHCYSVISIIESLSEYEILGIVDMAADFDPNEIKSNYKVISTLDKVLADKELFADCHFAIAIGDNQDRAVVYAQLREQGRLIPNFVSSHALVDHTVVLGDANIIAHHTIIGPQVKIGTNNLINTRVLVEHNSRVGNHSHLGPNTIMCGSSKIENLCLVGANSTLIPKTTLASFCTLGAGSVLIKNCESEGVTLVGIPAKVK
ncbi:acetyltransferase [Vibrio sp. VB16]|uniref:acetyltransferase n=1 Tax=Vibrio sp. VB16 TaxID=2785746 RepID=UPI00189F6353|nr:acetyltransferase [Vibrio sp. VB16]UGA57362.1 acetyltransferase [Vibrio sp. VB16]